MNEFERRLIDVMQNSSYLAAIIRRNPEDILALDYFGYMGTVAAVAAAGGTAQILVPIQADSDFALVYMSGAAVEAGTLNANHNGTIQITDTGTGKTFFSAPTLFPLVTGQGGFPFLLPSPRVIAPNVNIKFDLVNNSAAITVYYIAMLGARIYYKS